MNSKNWMDYKKNCKDILDEKHTSPQPMDMSMINTKGLVE